MKAYEDVDHMWREMLIQLLDQHRPNEATESRAGDMAAEVFGWSAVLNAGAQRTFLRNPIRQMSPAYCAAEVLWCFSGSNLTQPLLRYAPQYQERYGESDGTAWGAYGARLKDQWEDLFATLNAHRSGRQAVMQVWREEDLALTSCTPPGKRDIPCLTQMMFFVRDGQLYMSVTMRSNDAWLGFPCDVFAFTCLQRVVAAEVGAKVGPYIHCVPGSLHLYSRHLEKAKEAVQQADIPRYEPHGWQLDDTFSSMQYAVQIEEYLRCMSALQVADLPIVGSMGQDLLRACHQKLQPCTADPALPPPVSVRLRRSYINEEERQE